MARIEKITRFVIITYSDSGQVQAYADWVDNKGKKGRTTGRTDNPHMNALFLRSQREGITCEKETW